MKLRYIFIVVILLTFNNLLAQGQYNGLSPTTQTVSGYSGDLIEAKVWVERRDYGSGPRSYFGQLCTGNSSDIVDITMTNGGIVDTPGQYTMCTVYFRKPRSGTEQTSTYKFKFEQYLSCNTEQATVTITVVYKPSCPADAPQNLVASEITTNSLKLTWLPSNYPIFNYKIYYRKSTETVDNLFVYANCCSKIINNLESGVTYIFTIYADCQMAGPNTLSKQSSSTSATTLCSTFVNSPTNLSATPSGSGYIINFTNIPNYNGYYMLDYVNLSDGTSGSQTTFNGNYFYYVSSNQSFQFRIRPQGYCYAPPSNWITITPSSCSSNNYPTNLNAYSQCGSSGPPSLCGGILTWTKPNNTNSNQIEYIIFNVAGQTITGNFSTSSNSFTVSQYTNSSTGPWLMKFRARSRCLDGIWSAYSPWSANFVW
jgi:hypothetical protein